ncbi:excalibur calcium-binding domain-containing protein [Streptomyces maremycinicus]|uniref:excalibur calcium-binding domain-containing protein n=1 Tax=Streptomyces maremycinicus TaxID=1679753 RepID=UPI000788FC72|nr:excalibur calcium-binding domain-containing protein [Streptomyces sp. NBRC 110468]
MSNPYTTAPTRNPGPRWARKRYVLPALALALFIGVGIGGADGDKTDDAEPASAAPRPTVTVTATTTETAVPEPAGTVTATATETVKVKVTVTAKPAADQNDSGTTDDSADSADSAGVYYDNCTAARAAGAAPVRVGDPGYGRHLDRDGDGVACE